MTARQTCQRSAIIHVLHEASGPLRPAEIRELAAHRVPTLGVATVYRHLRQLQDSNEVRAVELGVSDVRYEPTNRGHHHHFLCRECGEAFDVYGCPEGISKLVPFGFEVDEHSLTLYGRCNNCTGEK